MTNMISIFKNELPMLKFSSNYKKLDEKHGYGLSSISRLLYKNL